MQDNLDAAVAKAERHGKPFSIALIDVDHFKRINDEWGHDVGDHALLCLTEELRKCLRAYDVCARWGGEEFLILLPETSGFDATEIANRLREQADQICSPALPAGASLAISVGVAEYFTGEKWDLTLKRADDALYRAKGTGRNCVVLAPLPDRSRDESTFN
jgi:diguanylate cyclase (GGDEF)-like protein